MWEVANECGKDTSDIISLRIDEPPVITSISDSLVSLCEGEGTVLKCEGTSPFTNLTYEWYKMVFQPEERGRLMLSTGLRRRMPAIIPVG